MLLLIDLILVDEVMARIVDDGQRALPLYLSKMAEYTDIQFSLALPDASICRYVKAYLTMMIETAILLGADSQVAAADCEAILDFEIEVAKVRNFTLCDHNV